MFNGFEKTTQQLREWLIIPDEIKNRWRLHDLASLERYVMHNATNESMEAILNGLDITSADDVLAVWGFRGDVPLALLEKSKTVTAIDLKENYLDEFKFIVRSIAQKEHEIFLSNGNSDAKIRNKYFSKKNRLNIIETNLFNLRLKLGNIYEVSPSNKFNKIYLSNTLFFMEDHVDEKNKNGAEMQIRKIAENLKENGLVYFTQSRFKDQNEQDIFLGENITVHKSLQKDEYLTALAREYEKRWTPLIYRKTSNIQ